MITYNSDKEAIIDFGNKYQALRNEISKVIVGQEDVIRNFQPGTCFVDRSSRIGKNFDDHHYCKSIGIVVQ